VQHHDEGYLVECRRPTELLVRNREDKKLQMTENYDLYSCLVREDLRAIEVACELERLARTGAEMPERLAA
jgi:hypothetical protein